MREHILPNAIGWRRATSHLVCSDCNAATSRFDRALSDAVGDLTTLFNPPGRRKRTPSTKAKESSVPITIKPGGIVEIPDAFVVRREPDGDVLSIAERARPDLEEKWRSRGKQLSELGELDSTLPDFALSVLELSDWAIIGGLKSGLHFAAQYVSEKALESPAVDVLRDVLLATSPDFRRLTSYLAWDFDYPDLDDRPFYHALELIACHQTGALAVRVHVYGVLRFRFVLSDSYSGRRHGTICEIEYAAERGSMPQERSRRCEHPVPWLLAFGRPMSEARVRSMEYFERHQAQALGHDLRPGRRPAKWQD